MTAPGNHEPGESIANHHPEATKWHRVLHRSPQPSWLEFYAPAFAGKNCPNGVTKSGWGRMSWGRIEKCVEHQQVLTFAPEESKENPS